MPPRWLWMRYLFVGTSDYMSKETAWYLEHYWQHSSLDLGATCAKRVKMHEKHVN